LKEWGVSLPIKLSGGRSRLATDSTQPPISASIGVAVYPQDGETMEALFRTADRELYVIKSQRLEEPAPFVCGL